MHWARVSADNPYMSVAQRPMLRGSLAESLHPLIERTARGMLRVSAISARHRPHWDAYVARHADGTLFHGIAWMEVVRETFNHQPIYLMACRGGSVAGVLPLFAVRSRFAGTMLVSVPYAVAGGVLADDEDAATVLWQEALAAARRCGAQLIDLRSETARIDDLPINDRYVTFKRELPTRAADVLDWLPRKARAAARNAENKHGLTVEFGRRHLRSVWRLYCRSMRRLGSLSYPYAFFEGLVERLPHDSFVQVVRSEGRTIGGLLSFRFNDVFLPYFVGCDERFNRLQTNNFIYLAAMRRAVEAGCTIFDFGRTRADNRGAYDFKRFHGFEPRPLGYQRWTAAGVTPANLTPTNPRIQWARSLWRHLPLPLCVRLSAWASRHIPG